MKVIVKNSFEHDTKKLRDKNLLAAIEDAIKKAESAKDVSEIPQLKKLSGYKEFFRIRIRDYRIGVSIENNEVSFTRFLHRKEIYRVFPPQ